MRLLLLPILILIALVSCGPFNPEPAYCRDKPMPAKTCEETATELTDVKFSEEGANIAYGKLVEGEATYVFREQAEYDSAFTNSYSKSVIGPFKNVDFNKNSVIGARAKGSKGTGYNMQYYICKSDVKNTYYFQLNYQILGQCAGSGQSHMPIYIYALIPKLKPNETVEFDIVDLNPTDF